MQEDTVEQFMAMCRRLGLKQASGLWGGIVTVHVEGRGVTLDIRSTSPSGFDPFAAALAALRVIFHDAIAA